ncbi:hypothetical protein GOBAR_DD01376 [Gossypium barbadense]|nr:hypothetical protein GOBAR_DD01376 [Gossypium barbadense]
MPVYPRAFHFPVSRHSLNENPLLCFAQCPSEVIRRFKDKTRSSRKNQASSSSGGGGGEGNQDGITDEEALSNITKQKAAAAKQYIENHYKEQMKNLQDRKERSMRQGLLSSGLLTNIIYWRTALKSERS